MRIKQRNRKEKYLILLLEELKTINPYRVILFGSHAWGKPIKNSDIDLIVVTNDTFIPESYEEKMNVYLKVSRLIRTVREKVPIDLIVYTRPEFEKIKKLNSLFIQEIIKNGKILI